MSRENNQNNSAVSTSKKALLLEETKEFFDLVSEGKRERYGTMTRYNPASYEGEVTADFTCNMDITNVITLNN